MHWMLRVLIRSQMRGTHREPLFRLTLQDTIASRRVLEALEPFQKVAGCHGYCDQHLTSKKSS